MLLLAVLGAAATKINYDILSYLPPDLESVLGEQYLENDYKLASTAMVTLEHMPARQVSKVKEKLREIPGVNQAVWMDDFADASIPKELLPKDAQKLFYGKNDSTLLLVTFRDTVFLDGKELSAQELEGKSGELVTTIQLTNHEGHTQQIAGEPRTIYTPFAVGMVLNLPVKTFQNVNAGDGQIITDAQNQIVALVGLPGVRESFEGLLDGELEPLAELLRDTFTVNAKVENFTMPQMVLAASTDLA